jgi:hypothetical protein
MNQNTIPKFLMDTYISANKNMNTTLMNLYIEYCEFCKLFLKKPISKIIFNNHLKDLNLHGYKSGNISCKLVFSSTFLNSIALLNKWIHTLSNTEDSDVRRFLRLKYITDSAPIMNTTLTILYNDFIDYTNEKLIPVISKTNFNKELKLLNLVGFKSGNISCKLVYSNIYLQNIIRTNNKK